MATSNSNTPSTSTRTRALARARKNSTGEVYTSALRAINKLIRDGKTIIDPATVRDAVDPASIQFNFEAGPHLHDLQRGVYAFIDMWATRWDTDPYSVIDHTPAYVDDPASEDMRTLLDACGVTSKELAILNIDTDLTEGGVWPSNRVAILHDLDSAWADAVRTTVDELTGVDPCDGGNQVMFPDAPLD